MRDPRDVLVDVEVSVLLSVLCVSVVVISTPFLHHGDTENTEKHREN